jgi:hypothetical protein
MSEYVSEVIILGTGSAYPDERNKTSYALKCADKYYLLDCGAPAGYLKHLQILTKINAIFISHLHIDHTLYLFDYLQSMKLLKRRENLIFYGPDNLSEFLFKTLPYLFMYPENLPYDLYVKLYSDLPFKWMKTVANGHLKKEKYRQAIKDGYPLSSGAKNTANTNFFGDAETQDVDFIIAGPLDGYSSGSVVSTLPEATTQANNLIAICEARKDCMAVISPRKADCVNNSGSEATDVITFAETLTSSSYAR